MGNKVVITGFSNPTKEGITLHTKHSSKIKDWQCQRKFNVGFLG